VAEVARFEALKIVLQNASKSPHERRINGHLRIGGGKIWGTGLKFGLPHPNMWSLENLNISERERDSEKHIDDFRKMLPQVKEEMDLQFLETEIEFRGLTS